ncbi:MAG: hypothetical protein HY265_06345 [Deltaproteobacteria bacterium]|nr:hypothetical protein [Deltaproteobacteria bacterium]
MKSMSEIIDTIRSLKNLSTDTEVALELGLKPKTLAVAKLRNSIPYNELITFCSKEKVVLDWLLTGEGKVGRGKPSEYKEGGEEKPLMVAEESAAYGDTDFVSIPMVSGKISAGKGLIPETAVELKLAFKKDWIQRHGDPRNMALIRVSGDSMEPTLYSGDIVLVDHNLNYIDPQGGIYAVAMNDVIMIKRVQVIYPSKKVRIISDNIKYKPLEASSEQVIINGKVIWFGREIER